MEIKEILKVEIEAEAQRVEKLAENCTLSEVEVEAATSEVWKRLQKALSEQK